MKRLEVFLLPLDGTLVYRSLTPSIKFAGTHLYTRVERGTVRVKCLAQEHNTMSSDRARTQTTRSGVKHTNHRPLRLPCLLYHRGPTEAASLVVCLKYKEMYGRILKSLIS